MLHAAFWYEFHTQPYNKVEKIVELTESHGIYLFLFPLFFLFLMTEKK